MGIPVIDLFASRTSHLVPAYMAWKPDPGSIATDALQQSWSNHFLYAFPPFCLIRRVLAKLKKEKVRLLLVTAIWQTQTWYYIRNGQTVSAVDSSASWVNVSRCEFKSSYIP